jgi:hypothetical protein
VRHWPYLFLLATSLLIAALVRDVSSPTDPARTVGRSKTPAAGAGSAGSSRRCEGIATDAAPDSAPRTACPLS